MSEVEIVARVERKSEAERRGEDGAACRIGDRERQGGYQRHRVFENLLIAGARRGDRSR